MAARVLSKSSAAHGSGCNKRHGWMNGKYRGVSQCRVGSSRLEKMLAAFKYEKNLTVETEVRLSFDLNFLLVQIPNWLTFTLGMVYRSEVPLQGTPQRD
jgi:hypothetical protein